MKKSTRRKTQNTKSLLSYSVYFAGLFLLIGFIVILNVRPKVLAEQAVRGKSQPTQSEATPGAPAVAKSDSPSPAPEPKKVEVTIAAPKKSDSPSPSLTPPPLVSNPITPIAVAPVEKVKLAIGGVGTYVVEIKSGDSAFDILKNAAEQNGFTIDYSVDPTFGIFLNSINGVENSYADSKYWTLYYNGAMAQVGASGQKVLNNDFIEWKYEVLSW